MMEMTNQECLPPPDSEVSTANSICAGSKCGPYQSHTYWFTDTFERLFNGIISPKHGQATLARLFLAPMMLPHYNMRRNQHMEILKRQKSFLEDYETRLGSEELSTFNTEYRDEKARVENLLYYLNTGHSPLAQYAQHGYASKTDSYATPFRYLSLYAFASQEQGPTLHQYLEQVERIYQAELEYIFKHNPTNLIQRIQNMLRILKGRGIPELPENADRSDTGKILSCSLLLNAAEGTNDDRFFKLLEQLIKLPTASLTFYQPEEPRREVVTIPKDCFSALCTVICDSELSPEVAEQLFITLCTLPVGQREETLGTLRQAVVNSRKLALQELLDAQDDYNVQVRIQERADRLLKLQGEIEKKREQAL